MAKEFCGIVEAGRHPREDDSPYGTYCKLHGNRRRRLGSIEAVRAEALGEQRSSLMLGRDTPGPCGACGVSRPERVLVCKYTGRVLGEGIVTERENVPFMLVCETCAGVIEALGPEAWQKAKQILTLLAGYDREELLMRLDNETFEEVKPYLP